MAVETHVVSATQLNYLQCPNNTSICNFTVNRNHSYKSKETRVVTYTCRYSSGHLIPIIHYVVSLLFVTLILIKITNISLYVLVCNRKQHEKLSIINPTITVNMECSKHAPQLLI